MSYSQNSRILSYLQRGKSLTPLDALNKFGCFRLGARIYDLKEQGHTILSTMTWVGKKRVARYSLMSPCK